MVLAVPDLKRQVQPQATVTPPEYKPFEEAGQKRNPINEQNAEAVKAWLNNLKPKFLEYMAKIRGGYQAKQLENLQRLAKTGQNVEQVYQDFLENQQYAAQSAYGFSQHMWNYLTMYRGEIVGHYLDEAAWEVIFSALGPIGNMMRQAYQKNISWKMAWMKNVLNPNAIYYYFNSMPTMMAYDVLKYPGRAVFAILEAGGAPLLSKVHVPEWNYKRMAYEAKQKVFFAPLYRGIQASHTLAEQLDKINGLSHDKKRFNSWFEETNNNFTEALLSHDKNKLNQLLKKYDGSIFRKALSNTARRLKSTERDPLSFLIALIVGGIWDFSIGLILNTLRLGITKVLSYIPGVNALRGQLIKFFTSNNWLQTAQMGKITGSTFLKGVFSVTTASSTYGGAWLGSKIAQLLGIPALPAQIIGGGLGTIAGSIYTTALKLAGQGNLPAPYNPIQWTQTFQELRWAAESPTFARIYAQELLDQGYVRGGRALFAKGFGLEPLSFRPGPLMRLGAWLSQNWWARLPINGFVWKDILLRIVPPEFLTAKILGIPLGGIINWLPAIDYFWQVKGGLFKTLTQPTIKLFGKTFVTPYYRFLSLQNPGSFLSKVAQSLRFQWLKIGYGEPAGFLYQEKGWLQGINQFLNNISRVFKNIKPYATNFFNPGFFMGFGISPLLTPTMGAWAYVVGPVAGSVAWLGATSMAASIAGMSPEVFMARFNPLVWAGYIVGSIMQLIFPGLPWWFNMATGVGFGIFGVGLHISFSMIADFLGVTVSSLVQGLLGPAYGAFASAMAIGATIASFLSIATLTVFAGFVIYAGFWVPMQDILHAGPESACFNLQTTAPQTLTPGATVEVCSKFSVKNPGLLTEFGFLQHYLSLLYLDIDDVAPQNSITKVSRQAPGEAALDLIFDKIYVNDPRNSAGFTNKNYALKYEQPVPTTEGLRMLSLNSFLSTYTSNETGPLTVFDLQKHYPQFSGLDQFTDGFIDLLQQVKEDAVGTKAKLETGQVVAEEIEGDFDNIVSLLNSAQNQTDIAAIRAKADQAFELAEKTTKEENSPFLDDIKDLVTSCSQQPSVCQEQINTYKSYSSFFNGQKTSLSILQNQLSNASITLDEAQNKTKEEYQQADLTLQGIKRQIQALKEMIDEVDGLDIAPWLSILNNIGGVTPQQIEQMLTALFKSFFNKKYFFTPGGTIYEVCVEGKYIGPTDRPVTFNSSVTMPQPGFSFDSGYLTFSQNTCSAISSTTVNP